MFRSASSTKHLAAAAIAKDVLTSITISPASGCHKRRCQCLVTASNLEVLVRGTFGLMLRISPAFLMYPDTWLHGIATPDVSPQEALIGPGGAGFCSLNKVREPEERGQMAHTL